MRLIGSCERVTGTVLPSNPGGYGFSVRIVSLLPSTTEILFAIGAGGDVVGVTFECDYPPELKTDSQSRRPHERRQGGVGRKDVDHETQSAPLRPDRRPAVPYS
jgi:hypothetical protein